MLIICNNKQTNGGIIIILIYSFAIIINLKKKTNTDKENTNCTSQTNNISRIHAKQEYLVNSKAFLTTCNIKQRAVLAGDPKVRGTSIKHNIEVLGWCTNTDGTIILGLKKREKKGQVSEVTLILNCESVLEE